MAKSRYTFIVLFLLFAQSAIGQEVTGLVMNSSEPVPYANVYFKGTQIGTSTDENGKFSLAPPESGHYTLIISAIGFFEYNERLAIKENQSVERRFNLRPKHTEMDEIVISGTLKEVNRLETPVPVEVYTPTFFRKNPTPSIYEAMQNVNGVRPQMNCNVCNTGDIHINGLEGPYTMVLIDGMPIVSGLSTVYGLFGIPNSIIERVEVVKGPASSLYGSEAVGGLINVITKDADKSPQFSADYMLSSWNEHNLDLSYKLAVSEKVNVLSGVNYFNYSNPIDNNGDGFTDITLQDRLSVFNKIDIEQPDNRKLTFATRFLYEDRWGGEMNWTPEFRGGDVVYGESIYTKRWEFISRYDLPENLNLSVSYNYHDQNSVYGDMAYLGTQQIGFSQLTWNKQIDNHDILAGTALRLTHYEDNTTATINPNWVILPGIFIQDDISLASNHNLLLGMRYDHQSEHGNIWTPRMAYRWKLSENDIFRINAGTGFRVVNLFTEEHAALTGARDVVITEALEPEQSYNINLNYIKRLYPKWGIVNLELAGWNTYFTNQILPDYDTDPNQIIYDNLEGSAVTRGISANTDIEFSNGLSMMLGVTYMDVYFEENGEKTRPVLAEEWTGTWGLSYEIYPLHLSIDYTGNFYGPMRLPLLGPNDPRSEFSPWFSIQNIQFTYSKPQSGWQLYGGIKNLLNFTPDENSIARSHDPFDTQVSFDDNGNPLITANNPFGLTFDPSYVYTSNQGIRGFIGVRYKIQ